MFVSKFTHSPHPPELEIVADLARELVSSHLQLGISNRIVISGCGTSGRIAWLCARYLSHVISMAGGCPGAAMYLIAGGDQSLVVSNELPEDDPAQGARCAIV